MKINLIHKFASRFDNTKTNDPQNSLTKFESFLNIFLLGSLVSEIAALAILESFVIYYDILIHSPCKIDMAMFGFEQTDYIYHGILIFASVYQLFLYLDALRQRNIFQLLALILFGSFFFLRFNNNTEYGY
jgi:hypothetical protein